MEEAEAAIKVNVEDGYSNILIETDDIEFRDEIVESWLAMGYDLVRIADTDRLNRAIMRKKV